MMHHNSEYISKLKLEEFKILLNEFDIELDEDEQRIILSIIKNNQYALIHDQYQFIIENYIKKLTSECTCQKIIFLLNHYFKPLLNI